MQLQVGVKVLLKSKEGKFLLVRRNPEKYPDVGAQWDIVGGRIEPGTPLIDNLKREVMEEVGLELSADVELVAAQDIIRRYVDNPDSADKKQNKDRHVVRLTYIGTIDGEPKIDEEHTEFNWFSGEEIKNLTNIDKYFIELVKRNLIKLH